MPLVKEVQLFWTFDLFAILAFPQRTIFSANVGEIGVKNAEVSLFIDLG
jgi:hypothetical protein